MWVPAVLIFWWLLAGSGSDSGGEQVEIGSVPSDDVDPEQCEFHPQNLLASIHHSTYLTEGNPGS